MSPVPPMMTSFMIDVPSVLSPIQLRCARESRQRQPSSILQSARTLYDVD